MKNKYCQKCIDKIGGSGIIKIKGDKGMEAKISLGYYTDQNGITHASLEIGLDIITMCSIINFDDLKFHVIWGEEFTIGKDEFKTLEEADICRNENLLRDPIIIYGKEIN